MISPKLHICEYNRGMAPIENSDEKLKNIAF